MTEIQRKTVLDFCRATYRLSTSVAHALNRNTAATPLPVISSALLSGIKEGKCTHKIIHRGQPAEDGTKRFEDEVFGDECPLNVERSLLESKLDGEIGFYGKTDMKFVVRVKPADFVEITKISNFEVTTNIISELVDTSDAQYLETKSKDTGEFISSWGLVKLATTKHTQHFVEDENPTLVEGSLTHTFPEFQSEFVSNRDKNTGSVTCVNNGVVIDKSDPLFDACCPE